MILDKRDIRTNQQKYKLIGRMSILEWFGRVWTDGGISSLAKKREKTRKRCWPCHDDKWIS